MTRDRNRYVRAGLLLGAALLTTALPAPVAGAPAILDAPPAGAEHAPMSLDALVESGNWCSRWRWMPIFTPFGPIWAPVPSFLTPEQYCVDCIAVRCGGNGTCLVTDSFCYCDCDNPGLVTAADNILLR